MAFFACSALFWTAVCVFYWGLRSIRRGRPTSAKTRALFHLGRTRALVCTCCRVCFADSSKPCVVVAYFFAYTVFLVSAARCPGPAALQRRERLCAHCRCGWFWLATIGAAIRDALQLLFGTLLSACSPRPVQASGLPLLALSDRSVGDVSTDVDVDYFLDVLPSELLPLVCLVCKPHCCGFSHACITSPLLSASCSS